MMECIFAKRTLQGNSINDVLREVYPIKSAFPTLLKLLQIALTIAVSTAVCEQCSQTNKTLPSLHHV